MGKKRRKNQAQEKVRPWNENDWKAFFVSLGGKSVAKGSERSQASQPRNTEVLHPKT